MNIMIRDRVKILSREFGAAYAMGREKFTHGEVKGIKGKIYEALWKGDSETTKSHVTNLRRMIKEADSATPANVMTLKERIEEIEKDIAIEDIRRKIEGWFKSSTSLVCVLPILEVHAQIHEAAHDEPGNWPKDFLQAMMKRIERNGSWQSRRKLNLGTCSMRPKSLPMSTWSADLQSFRWESCSRGKGVENTNSGK